MNRIRFVRLVLAVLILTLCAVFFCGCVSASKDPVAVSGYRLEKNEGRNSETYPYLVRTPHTVWYLAAADIELTGEEAFYEGLNRILSNQEADFTDAYAALDGYLLEEIPSIDVYTDFSGRSERAQWGYAGAYYLPMYHAIYLFRNWENAGSSLLHEYSHYLTHECCTFAIDDMFWSESIAEYISMFACTNRMGRSVQFAFGEDAVAEASGRGFTDPDGSINPRKLYCGYAAAIRTESSIGGKYVAVSQSPIIMTEELLLHPMMTTVSYFEAGSFFDWLVEHYGKELVFTHMTCEQRDMNDIFGQDFETLFLIWAEDNRAICADYGLVLD